MPRLSDQGGGDIFEGHLRTCIVFIYVYIRTCLATANLGCRSGGGALFDLRIFIYNKEIQ